VCVSPDTRVYQEAKQEGVKQVAVNLLNAGMEIEQVAKLTDLSVEEVRQLQVSLKDDA
jgi:predicted transposase/invertase (TIGR01784 family)